MSDLDILFPTPEGNRNADDMGMPQNNGPEFSDGHDCEGFAGGCARFGCPGAVSQHLCTALPNV